MSKITAAQVYILASALADNTEQDTKKVPKRVNSDILKQLAMKHDPDANIAWENENATE